MMSIMFFLLLTLKNTIILLDVWFDTILNDTHEVASLKTLIKDFLNEDLIKKQMRPQ